MSRPYRERRMLQFAVAATCVVPLTASLTGIALGADWLQRTSAATDMDTAASERRARAIFAAVAGAQLMARSRSDISVFDALIDSYREAGLLPG